jgi:hypothetical protein
MPEITADTVRNAVRRALDNEQNCRVRYLRSREAAAEGCYAFEVFCPNAHRHVVIFSRDTEGRLHSECQLPDDGEMCPSELGHHVCYHVASALPLFLAMEEGSLGRNAEAHAEAHLAGLTEIAVMLDAPLPRTATTKAARAFHETVREYKTPGGTVRDTRYRGVQI